MTTLLARWTEKLAGGPQAGTSDSPPLARVMGVGSQQQHVIKGCVVTVEVNDDVKYLGEVWLYGPKDKGMKGSCKCDTLRPKSGEKKCVLSQKDYNI